MKIGLNRQTYKYLTIFIYKDILVWEHISKPDRLEKLIQALALQIGSEVSFQKLGEIADLDSETIERYKDK